MRKNESGNKYWRAEEEAWKTSVFSLAPPSLPGPVSLSSLSSPLPSPHPHPTVTPLVLWDLPSCLHSPPPPPPCPPPLLPLSLLAICLPVLRRSSEDGATQPSSLEEQERSAGALQVSRGLWQWMRRAGERGGQGGVRPLGWVGGWEMPNCCSRT